MHLWEKFGGFLFRTTRLLGIVKYYCYHYLRCRLASKGIVALGVTLSRCVCACVCIRRITLGGESNALYPVISSVILWLWQCVEYEPMNGCGTEYLMHKRNLVVKISTHSSTWYLVDVMANFSERWKIISTMHKSEGLLFVTLQAFCCQLHSILMQQIVYKCGGIQSDNCLCPLVCMSHFCAERIESVQSTIH